MDQTKKTLPIPVPQKRNVVQSRYQPIDTDSATFNDIFDKLSSICTAYGPNVLKYEHEYQGKTETYIITIPNLRNVCSDIVYEHPRTVQYREAVHSLIKNEHYKPHLSQYVEDEKVLPKHSPDKSVDEHTTYMGIRTRLLDLSTDTEKDIAKELYELKSNPLDNLSPIPVTNKYYASLLVYKLWRSKSDFNQGISMYAIRRYMIDLIMTDPRKAIISNKYVFAAFWEYATKL